MSNESPCAVGGRRVTQGYMASGQRRVRSMMVRRCEKSPEGVKGPTTSMCTWLNLFAGTGILTAGECTCVWILDCWHARHSLVHWCLMLQRHGNTLYHLAKLFLMANWASAWETIPKGLTFISHDFSIQTFIG